ncbi:amino acid ABC transporter permease [bacterium LRH843]|nr:amino acid ABC transporter permease [bacterium LRH843]
MNLVFRDIIPYIPEMLKGLSLSIFVTIIAMALGLLLGIFAAVLRSRDNFILRSAGKTYIEIFRNTPLLVQLYLIYFGLGQLGIDINPLWSAVIGLTINNGAYTAEILRAGFSGVSKNLKEAGLALGLNRFQLFRLVVLPPAIKSVFPALTNQFILLFLFSSVASMISFGELTHQIMNIQSQTARTFEVIFAGLVLYYGVSSILSYLSKIIERKAFKW